MPRNHVPFDPMHCPFPGCEVEGTVPGIKRHVKSRHPELSDYDFPPLRTVGGLIAAFEGDEDNAEKVVAQLGIVARPEDTWEDLAEKVLAKVR